jgi:hypothetical protein
MRRTFGSLRHCVEADLFAMTDKSLGDVTDSRGLTISNADFVGGNCELVRLGGRAGASLTFAVEEVHKFACNTSTAV